MTMKKWKKDSADDAKAKSKPVTAVAKITFELKEARITE